MNQETCVTKCQKVKNLNYVSAGSLASLRNKKVSKHKHKQNSECISAVQVMKSNEKYHKNKLNSNYSLNESQVSEQVQQVSLKSTFPTVHEKVQQLSSNSTTPVSQVAHEQVQQQSQLSITPASQPVQEQMQQRPQNSTNLEGNNQSEEQDPTLNKKKRGGTQMQVVHGRSERKLILLNELNQPIGPTKEVEKYDIPEVGKDWALGAIKLAWREYKCRLKKMHFYAYADDATRMAKRPKFEMSHTNKENRKKLRYPHTVGKTSFAIICEEKKKETPDALSSKDLFVATRKRKPDRVYKDSHEDTIAKIAEMERIETQQSEDVTQFVGAFTTAMGQDHPDRVRLYGRRVTKTLLKHKQGDSGPSSQTVDNEKMQKKIEEMEERMQQRMQEKFNAQKDTMERDVTVNIIAQLQRLNPGLTLDPNMLRFTVGSPGNRAALQLINHPSVGCNNQG
ncbi:uncharacterized protein LOC125847145 [Solanum stenotomum]|uniref:uncharacterized protein LOC125847145 n=1 Tax=Solanum stenotomum TaxID=172797 RepID=UPI0020D1D621|nr:uncharacterized protein LOC125847145 [Solanum stenotomum]